MQLSLPCCAVLSQDEENPLLSGVTIVQTSWELPGKSKSYTITFGFRTDRGLLWYTVPLKMCSWSSLWNRRLTSVVLSEAAVKFFKGHFRKVVGEARLVFEELTMITAQIKECLNSRPLTPLPEASHNLESRCPNIMTVAALSSYHLPFLEMLVIEVLVSPPKIWQMECYGL